MRRLQESVGLAITTAVMAVLLFGCNAEPISPNLGAVTRVEYLPMVGDLCDKEYIPTDHIAFEFAQTEDSRPIQNTHRMGKEYGRGALGDVRWSIWVRNEFSRQCIDADLIIYTDAYGITKYGAAVGGWALLHTEDWAVQMESTDKTPFAPVPAFVKWEERGDKLGTWRKIIND